MFDLNNIDLSKILTSDFLKEHTNFASFEDFKSQLPVDLSSINLDQINEFVSSKTDFANIEEMVSKATQGGIADVAKGILGKLF